MAFTQCEWNEDVWKGATAGCCQFVGLINLVAAENGDGKTSEMLKNLGAMVGTHNGMTLKEQLGDESLDVQKLSELILGVDASFGARTEIEQESDSFRVRIHNCPLAEAFKMLDVDHDKGKRICEDWGVSLFHNLMEGLSPKAKYELVHYRKDWDDYCEESYALG